MDPFEEVEWEVRAAVIGNEKGKVVFEQRDVEIPEAGSQQATKCRLKYFVDSMGRRARSTASSS